jgi:hypothetical protein
MMSGETYAGHTYLLRVDNGVVFVIARRQVGLPDDHAPDWRSRATASAS